MKHIKTFESFISESFLNESIRLSSTDKLIDKMTIDDFDGKKWELNIVELDNELDPDSLIYGEDVYIVLTGKYARDTTNDSIMIPTSQWEEFKNLVNKIKR